MATPAQRNLLVELLVEELPPKALKTLGEAFAEGIADSLKAQGLAGADAVVTPYASPRRLAVLVTGVKAVATDEEVTYRLMPAKVAFGPDGKPTDAMRKGLLKYGRTRLADLWPNAEDGPDRLFIQADSKAAEYLYLRTLAKGASLDLGLQTALDEALAKLPIPKVMEYQLADGWTSVSFVRPAHALVALHGDAVVQCYALGLSAGRTTLGHRFEAIRHPIELRDADSYAEQLEREGAVIAGFDARRCELEGQLKAAAAREGLALIDGQDALLDEVAALVERPNVLLCEFEREFLEVPSECLVLTMQANQKYFPLLDGDGHLTNRFLVASNIRPADPSRIIEGNERVVRPRLADAKFFFDQDRKKTLASRVPGLAKVVYHGKLVNLGERVERIRAIARAIGQRLAGDDLATQADRAALLAKADLLTDMVGEFPELQGVMGGYYARHDGEPQAIASAIEDHYKPRFAGDTLPRDEVGLVVAIADKLETLAGLFGIGQVPSGDKDPFALRRHALGVVRLLTERALPLPLRELIDVSFEAFPPGMLRDARTELETFMLERLASLLRERGFTASEVESVMCLRPERVDLVPRQLEAVRKFAALPESATLAAANKRVVNILKKADGAYAAQVDTRLLTEPAEAALHGALTAIAPGADAAFERGDYTASLQTLATLKNPVDAFFDSVMVNAQDPALRANRLGLLAMLQAAMNRVADLSKLAV